MGYLGINSEREEGKMFRAKYNMSTVHIDGLSIRTKGSDLNYSLSACSALTRNGYRMAASREGFNDVREALAAARGVASALGRKLCKKCEQAAEAQIAAGDFFYWAEDEAATETVEQAEEAAEAVSQRPEANEFIPISGTDLALPQGKREAQVFDHAGLQVWASRTKSGIEYTIYQDGAGALVTYIADHAAAAINELAAEA